MIWYRALDFFKTRNGQMVLFALALTGLFLVAARVHKARQQKKQEEESHLPRLSQNEFWEGKEAGDHFGRKLEFEVGEVKPITQLFRLPPKKDQPSPQVRVQESPKQIEESFIAPLPMIAFQRSVSPIAVPEEPEEESLASESGIELEPGRLLYCQLLAPVFSGQGNAPVLGQLTRSYVSQGRVILPAGTTVTGQLQGATAERLNFNSQWIATLPTGRRIDFSAQLQEAARNAFTGEYAVNDGLAGLPAQISQQDDEPNRWGEITSTVVGATGRLAQDRFETEIGEIVPSSGRNTAIKASTAILEELFENGNGSGEKNAAGLAVPAGEWFYLFITSSL
ncbi:hypothetical protein [Roseibacillus persicicus]|uniref:Uncharacterized protein n=1 Tax=Roseibacillus persicicus TaxID=454148 RepID=A0A918TR17_9BACT|nr:hypothetical protein [Roseibacillus persicicus]GHC55980.1 hypothetical protein GCM10007100_23570 [Roseibacillus persicicus]